MNSHVISEQFEAEKTEANVISFIGTTPNIGTTLAALRHSFHIAEFTMCKVVYICLNFKSSKLHRYFGLTSLPMTLDSMLPNLKNRQISDETFTDLLYKPSKDHDIYILFGNQQRVLAEQYMEDDLLYLIELAKKKFDYIILDSSSYWDNAGSFVALQAANHIVVATTDARSNFQEDFKQWFGSISPHISLPLASINLLLIRQTFSDQYYSFKDIVAETSTTPYIDSLFPTTVYSFLDRGEILEWLLRVNEAKAWCADSCHMLLNPAHLSQLTPIYQPSLRMYWPWQRKEKTVQKLGG